MPSGSVETIGLRRARGRRRSRDEALEPNRAMKLNQQRLNSDLVGSSRCGQPKFQMPSLQARASPNSQQPQKQKIKRKTKLTEIKFLLSKHSNGSKQTTVSVQLTLKADLFPGQLHHLHSRQWGLPVPAALHPPRHSVWSAASSSFSFSQSEGVQWYLVMLSFAFPHGQ